MKEKLIIALLGICPSLVFAQQDTIIMHINGKAISRTEFEQAYRRDVTKSTAKVSAKDYTELFINNQLKINAAQSVGLDTLDAFRKQVASYRFQLLLSNLKNQRANEALLYSTQRQKNADIDCVEVLQITKYLPQNTSARGVNLEQQKMDSIYQAIINEPTSDFLSWVDRFSDEKKSSWVKPLHCTKEFEQMAFALQSGEVSKPFLSPEGIHILKVIARKKLSDLGESPVCRENENVADSFVQELKAECRFIPNKNGIDELFEKGETDKELFMLANESYTGDRFKLYSKSTVQGVKRQLDGFIVKSLLDYKTKELFKSLDLNGTIQNYEETLLAREITYRNVDQPAATDKTALSTYFQYHKSDYQWDTLKFKGVVVHCKDKKILKQVKKIIKKKPDNEWVKLITDTFNSGDKHLVKTEEGLFSEGENAYVDGFIYKKKRPETQESYPFTLVLGKKQKGPEHYMEVSEQVKKDYRNFLNFYWLGQLRASSKVEINQEVLKTVNNI